MEYSLGISRFTGSIDRQSCVMDPGLFISGKHLLFQDLIGPYANVDHFLTATVFSDISDPLRRIIVLYHGKGSPRFPHAKHTDQRGGPSGQTQKHKVLTADLFFFQPCIDPAGQLIHSTSAKTARMTFVCKHRR